MRIHLCDFAPTYFGNRRQNRFDSMEQSFGVLYLARQLNGSFVEVFYRTTERHLSAARLEQYCVSEFRASRNLKLIDLAGHGLVKMRLDARLATGSYATSQSWSQAFYEHPGGADGILYPSRHDPKQQLDALFDRSQTLLKGNGDIPHKNAEGPRCLFGMSPFLFSCSGVDVIFLQ